MRTRIRLSREEYLAYKKLDIDGKWGFIKSRVSKKSKEDSETARVKPIVMMPIVVLLVSGLIGIYCNHLGTVLGLKNMNEYVYCNNCGTYHRADRVQRYQISHSEVGTNVFEDGVCCPLCGCDDLEDARLCLLCESPTHRSVLCDDCLGEVGVFYDMFVDAVQKRWADVSRSDVAEILIEAINDL